MPCYILRLHLIFTRALYVRGYIYPIVKIYQIHLVEMHKTNELFWFSNALNFSKLLLMPERSSSRSLSGHDMPLPPHYQCNNAAIHPSIRPFIQWGMHSVDCCAVQFSSARLSPAQFGSVRRTETRDCEVLALNIALKCNRVSMRTFSQLLCLDTATSRALFQIDWWWSSILLAGRLSSSSRCSTWLWFWVLEVTMYRRSYVRLGIDGSSKTTGTGVLATVAFGFLVPGTSCWLFSFPSPCLFPCPFLSVHNSY